MKIELVPRKVSAHSLTTYEHVLSVGIIITLQNWGKDVNNTFICISCSTRIGCDSVV